MAAFQLAAGCGAAPDDSPAASVELLGRRDGGGGGSDGGSSSGGTPTGRCAAGLTNCRGTCVDLQDNPRHCGACATECTGGTCQSGVCCKGSTSNCGGACVDLQTSYANCGSCGATCTGTEVCDGGVCEPTTSTLHVVILVENDNGGTATEADFATAVTATDPVPGSFSGSEDVTIGAGSYSVSTTGPAGYNISYSSNCSGSVDPNDDVTCTVTAGDLVAHLTVIKHVINDNGGTASAGQFTMQITGGLPSMSSFPGSETGTTVSLNASTYVVSETGPAGYVASFSAECSGTIGPGESRTCTITNNDFVPQ